jgi:hypothetical protein
MSIRPSKGFEDIAHQLGELNMRLDGDGYTEFVEQLTKELAARLLQKVIDRTPVHRHYPKGSGMVGGTLRRGWTGGKEIGGANPMNHVRALVRGVECIATITNPVDYGVYVEYGHRTHHKDGSTSWTKGKFFLTKARAELQAQMPAVIEARIQEKFKEVFGGK